jgi:hypothetical protein
MDKKVHLNQLPYLKRALKEREAITKYFDIDAEGNIDKFLTLSEKQYKLIMVLMHKREKYEIVHDILNKAKIKKYGIE